jgi:rubrerythrin
MAKDKESPEEKKAKEEHKRMHEVYKSGEKYHCGECGSELVMGKDCPTCKASINWEQIIGQARYR